MKTREIKKVKIKSSYAIEIEYTETVVKQQGEEKVNITSDVTATYRYPLHEDLINAMKKLSNHVACICELADRPEAVDTMLLNSIDVTGYTIGGADEHEGVVIVAKRNLRSGKVLNLITPFVKWEDEHNGYEYSYELGVIVSEIDAEVHEYLNGKHAPDPQLEIAFGESDEK